MILRGLEITDPNAQVEKGMATSFPPLWWFRTKDKPPPGALDPILPLDVARIIVSYLMDIHVLMVHFEDRVLYMIRLEEFVRLCHHYYTGETIPQAKLYLVTLPSSTGYSHMARYNTTGPVYNPTDFLPSLTSGSNTPIVKRREAPPTNLVKKSHDVREINTADSFTRWCTLNATRRANHYCLRD